MYATPAKHKWAWVGNSTALTTTQLAVFDKYWGAGGAVANPDLHHSCVMVSKGVGKAPFLLAADCSTVLGPTRCCQIAAT